MTSTNEMKLLNTRNLKILTGKIRPFTQKSSKFLAGQQNDANFTDEKSSNETMHKILHLGGDDIIVPEMSHDGNRKESLNSRGGKCNLKPNHNPSYSEDFRY